MEICTMFLCMFSKYVGVIMVTFYIREFQGIVDVLNISQQIVLKKFINK